MKSGWKSVLTWIGFFCLPTLVLLISMSGVLSFGTPFFDDTFSAIRQTWAWSVYAIPGGLFALYPPVLIWLAVGMSALFENVAQERARIKFGLVFHFAIWLGATSLSIPFLANQVIDRGIPFWSILPLMAAPIAYAPLLGLRRNRVYVAK